MPGSVLFPLLVVSTLFNSKAMILPPKSCKSQGLSLFSFFHICNVSAFVRGGREGTAGLGAFCCALKEDLSLKDFWNKVCRAKARLAQELALTSSKPPHSQCTDLLFLLFLGQIFRHSLFSLFRDSSPHFLLLHSTWDKMLPVASLC